MKAQDLLDSINEQTARLFSNSVENAWIHDRKNYHRENETLVSIQWERLQSRMPEWLLHHCKKECITVGEWLCPNSYTGKTVRSSDGWLIAVPSGLLISVYQIAISLASWIPLTPSLPSVISDEEVRNEVAIALSWLARAIAP